MDFDGNTKKAFKYVPFRMDFKSPADHKIDFRSAKNDYAGETCEDECLEI